MNPVEPVPHEGAQLVIFARDQPQYSPLPASVDASGVVMTEWLPTAEEMMRLMEGGHVRLWTWTFHHPLQPVRLEVAAPSDVAEES